MLTQVVQIQRLNLHSQIHRAAAHCCTPYRGPEELCKWWAAGPEESLHKQKRKREAEKMDRKRKRKGGTPAKNPDQIQGNAFLNPNKILAYNKKALPN